MGPSTWAAVTGACGTPADAPARWHCGVFAGEDLPKGVFLAEYAGELLDKAQVGLAVG
jgi:hypothetical protein